MLSSFSYSIVAKLLSILGSYWLKPVTFLSRSTKEIFEDMEKFCGCIQAIRHLVQEE